LIQANSALVLIAGLVLFPAPQHVSAGPAEVFVQGTFALGQKHVVIGHADTDGYPDGTYFRWEWFRDDGLVRVTREPYTSFYMPETPGSEIRFVQVAYLPGGKEHREVSSNHVLVQMLDWPVTDGIGSGGWPRGASGRTQWNSGGSPNVN